MLCFWYCLGGCLGARAICKLTDKGNHHWHGTATGYGKQNTSTSHVDRAGRQSARNVDEQRGCCPRQQQCHRRRLQWHPYLGHSVLKANFPQGKKELVVSLLQAIVLLLFNEDESISYREILSATAIDDKELKVCLQSLACGKQRVLRKEPKGREVAEDDVFFFDVTFKTPVRRSRSPGCHTCTCATRCARSSKLAAPCLLPVVCSAVHSFTVSRSTPSRCEKQSKRMSRRQNVSSRIVAIRSMVRCPSLKNAVCLGLILTER